jgi:hypothetical protein
MRKIVVIVQLVFLGTLGFAPARATLATGARDTSGEPSLTSLQIVYKGNVVDWITSGAKGRKYQINLTGTGFTVETKARIGSALAPTTFVSATELVVKLPFRFVPGGLPLALWVETPDERCASCVHPSNTLLIKVRNQFDEPLILSVYPASGPVGTLITVSGRGFDPLDNRINFGGGAILGNASVDADTIVFAVPEYLLPGCYLAGCRRPNLEVTPGTYGLSVTNSKGTSDGLDFLVTK